MVYAEELADAFGYLTQNEVYTLKRYAAIVCRLRNGSPVIVNIGAGAGTSALAFREECPNAMLFSVDMSPGGPRGGLEGERNAFMKYGLQFPHQILGRSEDVGKSWTGGGIDLLFIDADHQRPGLTADIESWFPHVYEGGFVLFHDYDKVVWPDVKAVVDEMMNDYVAAEKSDSVIAYINIKKTLYEKARRSLEF